MERSLQEQDNGTVDAIASSTINDLDLEAVDDSAHDQLPTLEEYKASLPAGTSSPARPTADQPSPYQSAYAEDVANFDESASYVQDQLPTVEEIKAMQATGDDDWACVRYFAIFVGLVVLTVIIVVPTMLTQDNRSSSSVASVPSGTLAPVAAPTISPLSRKENIIQYLTQAGIATETQLTTAGTPQNKAVDWMTFNDKFDIAVPETNNKYTRFTERYVLAVFYYSTDGPGWTYNLNFLTSADHCEWNAYFLTNRGDQVRLGVALCSIIEGIDEAGGGLFTSVISIPSNALAGTLPSELQYLHRLQVLYTPYNIRLGGNLDIGLQNLEYLESLELQYCGLGGTIPTDIGRLTKLSTLAIGNNDLAGELPDSLFTLTALEMLAMDDNMLEGNLASFAKLSNLRILYCEDNQLTGELTDTLLQSWSINMKELDMSRNLINSTIPASMFSMSSLEILDLHGNSLRGSIPEIPNRTGILTFLALHENDLTGQIPTSISNLVALQHLDIAKNKLVSPIPDTLGLYTDLQYLFMGGNNFSPHPMPIFLWPLTGLRELSMKNNSITGTIPSSFVTLSRLQLLDLDANMLTGTIPPELGLIQGLDYLLLNRNSLSGTIPSTFGLLYDLDILLIDHNKINGTAEVICNNTNSALQFFVADCEGPNPNMECSCCNLCCNDLNATCNNLGWSVSLDPIWEYGYERQAYTFSDELIASEP